MIEEKVVLVDLNDNAIGLMNKQEAHLKGLLHRAFSIFIFNSKNQLLLQQRALSKYHSAGLWTNTCCSHPRDSELLIEAANRRLYEEMGMKCEMTKEFDFIYNAKMPNNLIEHEFDHVFFGNSDKTPIINNDEVAAYKYMSLIDIKKDIDINNKQYTEWFKICFNEVLLRVNNINNDK
jgi:isopentenyl-diphosphate delta-isomerase